MPRVNSKASDQEQYDVDKPKTDSEDMYDHKSKNFKGAFNVCLTQMGIGPVTFAKENSDVVQGAFWKLAMLYKNTLRFRSTILGLS